MSRRLLACAAVALAVLGSCSPAPPPSEPDGRSSGVPRTTQGVTADSITLGFEYQMDQCGFDLSAILNQLGLNPQQAISAYIDYFNATANLYGRKLKAVFADNGGPFCPDKARAAGVKLAKDDKVFAVLGDGGAQYATVDAASTASVFHVGGGVLLPPDSFYSSHAPYAWNPGMTGSQLAGLLGSYIGNKLKDQPRVFGLFLLDDPTAGPVAAELTKKLATYGIPVAKTVRLAIDPGTALEQVANAVAQFKAASVTDLILLSDPLSPFLVTQQAASQGWQPCFVVSSYGLLDVFEVVTNYSRDVWQCVRGISILVPRDKTYDRFEFFKAYQQFGTGLPPTDSPAWFFRLQVLVEGLKQAGPDLTRESFVKGMRKIDLPTVDGGPHFRFGESYGAIVDAMEIKWDVAAQNYVFPDRVRRESWDTK
jgi:branched-chain amino acid transport system substrate-binding protein